MEDFLKPLNAKLFTLGEHTITVAHVVFVPTMLILGWILLGWLVRFISNRLTKNGVAPDVIHLLRRVLYILGFVVLGITTLDFINVPITAFAFVSGAVAIGVGFGAQNIINNFISGWILMWERPIRIGDFLEIGETKGTVETINTRSTRIRRVDGVHLLIPNSQLLENTVVNWTLVDKLARGVIRVGVAYGSPSKIVAELILQAANENADVISDPKPMVFFEDFGDSALIFDLYFWIETSEERSLRGVKSALRYRIDELFSQSELVIPFPQRDVHVDGELVIKRASKVDNSV